MKISKMWLFIIIAILFMIGQVWFFNYTVNKDKEKIEEPNVKIPEVDLSNASNVSTIDDKLGDDLVITQSYLMRYVIKKRGIWYQSSGYVKRIVNKNGTATINIVSEMNSNDYIKLYIDSSKCNVKNGDLVFFVGTINLDDASMNLALISNEEISYSNSTNINISDLINNVSLLKETKFIIRGYMVTDENVYKLYDSKDNYKNEERYFVINWKDEFNYTGNQNVMITCVLGDGYNLKDCILNE